MIILRLVPFRLCCILDEQPQDILVQGCIHFSMLPPFFMLPLKLKKLAPLSNILPINLATLYTFLTMLYLPCTC